MIGPEAFLFLFRLFGNAKLHIIYIYHLIKSQTSLSLSKEQKYAINSLYHKKHICLVLRIRFLLLRIRHSSIQTRKEGSHCTQVISQKPHVLSSERDLYSLFLLISLLGLALLPLISLRGLTPLLLISLPGLSLLLLLRLTLLLLTLLLLSPNNSVI